MGHFKRPRHSRLWSLPALVVTCCAQLAIAADDLADVSRFVRAYCLECHSGGQAEAGLRLDRLSDAGDTSTAYSMWVKVHDRVVRGEMPPAGAPSPTNDTRRQALRALSRWLTSVNLTQQRSRGRVQLRRLNRDEYENTLRDLLGLPHLEVREQLPADQSAHGFDNVGAALELSSVHMRRYLAAADYALKKAIVLSPAPSKTTVRREARSNGRLRQVLGKGRDAAPVGNSVGLLRQPNTAQAPWWWSKFSPPVDGNYRIRMKSFGFIWDGGRVLPADRTHAVTYQAVLGGTKRPIGTFDIGRSEDRASVHDFVAFLRRGDQLQMWFETLDDRTKGNFPLQDYTAPGVAVEWLEVEGPLVEAAGASSYRRLFGELPIEPWTPASGLQEPPVPMVVNGFGKRAKLAPAKRNKINLYHVVSPEPSRDARRLLVDFATRAFRRPVEADEIADITQLVDANLARQVCFQEALRTGFQAILCSPEFLFLQERPGRLDDHALAARLSYFIWRSLPDQVLLDLAQQGRLHLDDELHRQVERMLDDPKSQRMVESFCGQWLDLRDISVTQPDEQLYPEFDHLLLNSMVEETLSYFTVMLGKNLGVEHLVDSEFLMINGRLAQLYEIPDVDGVRIRSVDLPPDSPRGGLLTQASILKVTANGTTTSPVTRGTWLLDRLYGLPSPGPPSNISAIEPDVRGTTTIRQQLDRHRSVDACARCHRRIDPPGFALESFDVIGGWRQRYRSLGEGDAVSATFKGNRPVRYRLGLPVDTSGVTPDGQSFKDVREFRQILLTRRDQLARNLARRLLVFATGAEVQFADRQVVDEILRETAATGFGLRSLVHAVVQSEPFRRK